MPTNKDTGDEGLHGSTAASPDGVSSLSGVQAFDESVTNIGHADLLPGQIAPDGPQNRGSLLGGSISSDLTGFAAKPWIPFAYQERGIEWLVTRPEGALFLPPGMGKTSITLAAQEMLGRMGMSNRMLVLAPLSVCLTTWMSEPLKWAQFQGLKIGLAHGPDKELILNDPYYDLVVLNYDGLAWAVPMLMQGHSFSILVYDELTRLKNSASKRFKIIKPLLPSFKFRWGLTGTPAANGLTDLFGQCYVLDLGKRLGRFITHFRLNYLYQEPWDQYRYYIRPEKAQKMIHDISDMAMYLDPKDHLQLPELLDVPLEVDLPPNVLLQYKVLEQEFIIKVKEGVVTAANAGVLTSKLRQFTGGGIYSEDEFGEQISVRIHDAKLDRLEALVEELAGEPLLVAYQFNHELDRLRERFPQALAIKGGMKKGELQDIVATWNTGNIPLLFVQPAAASLGLNLQFGGSAICWFTMTYNLEDFLQMVARVYRQGQKNLVRNYLLLANRTIDRLIAELMIQKDATQNTVFQGLKTYSNLS